MNVDKSVALFSTLETNSVTSHWSVISLSFPTVLSSVAIHITISTSDCVGHGNILSSLVCTHCVRLIPFVLFRLLSVYLMSMRLDITFPERRFPERRFPDKLY